MLHQAPVKFDSKTVLFQTVLQFVYLALNNLIHISQIRIIHSIQLPPFVIQITATTKSFL